MLTVQITNIQKSGERIQVDYQFSDGQIENKIFMPTDSAEDVFKSVSERLEYLNSIDGTITTWTKELAAKEIDNTTTYTTIKAIK